MGKWWVPIEVIRYCGAHMTTRFGPSPCSPDIHRQPPVEGECRSGVSEIPSSAAECTTTALEFRRGRFVKLTSQGWLPSSLH
jgi:hypothetical protein